MAESTSGAAAALKQGTVVFVILAFLTGVEFVIAVSDMPGKFLLLVIAALAKAWLIVQYFMHVGQLRGDHE